MPTLDTFTTARLRAERLTDRDWLEVRRLHIDALAMAELGGVQTEEQSRAYFERNLGHWDDHGFGLWMVYEVEGTTPIGRAVLRHLLVAGVDEVEVGYAFYPEFWGRGFATEVTAACLRLAFDDLDLRSVVGVTTPANGASQRVLVKNGLAFERDIVIDGVSLLLYRVTRLKWSASAHAP